MIKFKGVRKNVKFKKFFLLALLSLINLNSIALKSEEFKNEVEDPTSNKAIYYDQSTEYILGPGDKITINFNGLDIFDGNYVINPEGYLLLPEVEYIYANKKTLPELKNLLLKEYQKYVIDPNFVVSIGDYRELNVLLRGEVNTIGLFKLKYSRGSRTNTGDRNNIYSQTQFYPPKLFDLIQKGQGITANADLKNIVIIRDQPIISGGGKIKTQINLISLLENGDQSQNITLRDGDEVIVGKTETTLYDQLNVVNKSNLTPSTINVFLNGNVGQSGSLTIYQGASLYEAISAAGEKSLSGRIELIRLKNAGKNEKRFISYNKNSIKGSYDNPILVSGDIITVRKNLLGKTTQAIREYSNPVINSYALYKIFN